jgi:hypothetical protein
MSIHHSRSYNHTCDFCHFHERGRNGRGNGRGAGTVDCCECLDRPREGVQGRKRPYLPQRKQCPPFPCKERSVWLSVLLSWRRSCMLRWLIGSPLPLRACAILASFWPFSYSSSDIGTTIWVASKGSMIVPDSVSSDGAMSVAGLVGFRSGHGVADLVGSGSDHPVTGAA